MAWLSSEDSEEDIRVEVEEKIQEFIGDLERQIPPEELIEKWKIELQEWKKK